MASILIQNLWWFSYWWQSSDSEEELLNIYRRRAVPTSGAGEGTFRRSQNSTPVGLSNDTINVSIESTQKSSVGKQFSICVIGNEQLPHR